MSNLVKLISQLSQRLNMKGNEDFKNVFNMEADKIDWIKDKEITPKR